MYELAKRRQIPCLKIGRLYRFDMADIQAWLKIRKRG